MTSQFEGRSDEELREAGYQVVRPTGATAEALFHLLQGTGPLSEGTARDTSDHEWNSIPVAQRRALHRLDTWCAVLPDLPAGEARTLAFDPSLTVVDATERRLVLLPGRREFAGHLCSLEDPNPE